MRLPVEKGGFCDPKGGSPFLRRSHLLLSRNIFPILLFKLNEKVKLREYIVMSVQADLLPMHSEKTFGAMKAERTVKRITFDPAEANTQSTIYVSVPKLNENEVLVPGSLALVFEIDLAGGHANNYLVQNVSRALVDKVVVKYEGNVLQETVGYDIFKIWEDLFLPQEEQDNARGNPVGGHQQDPLERRRQGHLGRKENQVGGDLQQKVPDPSGPPDPYRPRGFLPTGPLQQPRVRADPGPGQPSGERLGHNQAQLQAEKDPARVRNDPSKTLADEATSAYFLRRPCPSRKGHHVRKKNTDI